MEIKTFPRHDAVIAYEQYGEVTRPSIVFIHGFPFSRKMWKKQVQDLAPHYHVVTYDLRGLGASTDKSNQFTMEMLVDDLIALLDHLKFEKAAVVGFSMGGYVALRAIEREPGRFSALVLADTQSASDTDAVKLKRTAALKTIQARGLEAYGAEFLKSAVAPKTQENPDLVKTLKDLITSNSVGGTCGALLAMVSRTDTTESLKNIKVPTLVIVGSEDKVTPPTKAESLKNSIPNATLAVITGAGHMSSIENHESFNAELVGFLHTHLT
jgi:3-oxoadipate enol-lactonase